jgi:hypothetical protein
MKGWLVKMKNSDRLGVISLVDENLWEVRLLSGSMVIGHKDFFQVIKGE